MINRTRHNTINNNARLATSHFFQYGLRSFAFLIFLCVTLFYIPLYRATLPPYHDHFENNRDDTGKKFSVSASKSRIKRTLDISISMRVCFEIIAPSMEIGLHPPELVRSLCRRQIPPLLLVNGNSQKKQQNQKNGSQDEQQDEAVSLSSLLTTPKGAIRPQDRPYVQKVLRHFSSIVVLHDVAFTLYESTVKQLRQNCAQRKNVSDEKTRISSENDDVDIDDDEDESSVSHHHHRHDETRFISDHYYHSFISFIDFWTAEFPIAIFWAFMQNAEKFLRVVDAVNWLRLLPSLTFLSPQVRGGMITFYILSLIATFYYNNNNNNDSDDDSNNNNSNNSNFVSFEDISWAFHFCALVVFMEWVSAVSDRFVVLQQQPQQQPRPQINNTDNNEENEDTARLVIPVYLFASQYNRKVLAQECGYLLLQILVPPFVAGVVLSGLVALAVIVVH